MALVTDLSDADVQHVRNLAVQINKILSLYAFGALKEPREILDTLNDFMTYLRFETGLRPETTQSYCSDARAFAAYFASQLNRTIMTTDFTPENFRAFIAHLRASGRTESTVSRRFQGLHRYSAYLVNRNLAETVLTHEALGIRFKRRDRITRYLTLEEFKRLMVETAFEPDSFAVRNWALINLLYYEYLRVTEALRLKWKDIDLEASLLTLGKTVKQLKPQTINVLRKYLTGTPDPDAPLFPSKSGRHLLAQSYRQRVARPALRRIAPEYRPTSMHPRDWPAELREQLLNSLEPYHV